MAGVRYSVQLDDKLTAPATDVVSALERIDRVAGGASSKVTGAGKAIDTTANVFSTVDRKSASFDVATARVTSFGAMSMGVATEVRSLGESTDRATKPVRALGDAMGGDIAARPIASLLKLDAAVGRFVGRVDQAAQSVSRQLKIVGLAASIFAEPFRRQARVAGLAMSILDASVRSKLDSVKGAVSRAVNVVRGRFGQFVDSVKASTIQTQSLLSRTTNAFGRMSDRVSSSVKGAASAMSEFGSRVRAKFEGPLSRVRKVVDSVRGVLTRGLGVLRRWRKGSDDAGKGTKELGDKVSDAKLAVASFVGNLAANAVGKLLEFGRAAVGAAVNLLTLGDRASFAFGKLAKGAFPGEKAMKLASATAMRLGADLTETTELYTGFLSSGLDIKMSDQLVLLANDFKATGNAIAGSRLADTIQEIQQKAGAFTGTEMMSLIDQLKDIDVSRKSIEESLSGIKGVDVNLEADIKANKISADELQQAIIDASNKALGQANAGDIAKEFADKTFAGAVGRAKAVVEGGFATLGSRVLDPLTQRMKPMIDRFQEWVMSEDGERFFDRIGSAVESTFKVLDKLGSIFGDSFGETFGVLREALEPVFGLFEGKGGTMLKVLENTARVLGTMAAVGVAVLGTMAAIGGAVIGFAITLNTIVYDTIIKSLQDAVAWFGETFMKIGEWWDQLTGLFNDKGMSLGTKVLEIGKHIIGGLVDGIKAGAGAVVDAVVGIGENLVGAFKRTLGIHSPSTVMREAGVNTTSPIAPGMLSNMSDIERASERLGDAASSSFTTDIAVGKPMFSMSHDSVTVPPADMSFPSFVGDAPQRSPEAYDAPTASAMPNAFAPVDASKGAGGGSGLRPIQLSLTQHIEAPDGASTEEVARIAAREARREIESVFESLEQET